MFKKGQKVIVAKEIFAEGKNPEKGQIVTISDIYNHPLSKTLSYFIFGYERDFNNKLQVFSEDLFEPYFEIIK